MRGLVRTLIRWIFLPGWVVPEIKPHCYPAAALGFSSRSMKVSDQKLAPPGDPAVIRARKLLGEIQIFVSGHHFRPGKIDGNAVSVLVFDPAEAGHDSHRFHCVLDFLTLRGNG